MAAATNRHGEGVGRRAAAGRATPLLGRGGRGPLAPLRGCCRCLALTTRCLDTFLLRIGDLHLEREPQPAIMQQVRRLRGPLVAILLVAGLAVLTQVACLVMGCRVLADSEPDSKEPECRSLHIWLLGFCLVLAVFSASAGVWGPLAVGWAIGGRLVRADLPFSCAKKVPDVWYFIDVVLDAGLLSSGCWLFCGVLFWGVSRRMQRLRERWGPDGPVAEEVIRSISTGPPARDIPPGQECVICLEAYSPRSTLLWRRLLCNHVFHERCLLAWLRRGRRCPLCRFDLHQAYLAGWRGGVPSPRPAAAVAAWPVPLLQELHGGGPAPPPPASSGGGGAAAAAAPQASAEEEDEEEEEEAGAREEV